MNSTETFLFIAGYARHKLAGYRCENDSLEELVIRNFTLFHCVVKRSSCSVVIGFTYRLLVCQKNDELEIRKKIFFKSFESGEFEVESN